MLTVTLVLASISTVSLSHHSVLYYDGKTEVTISGIIKKARYGFPHSIYQIDVKADDGSIERWILSTEDPRDAKRLGFDEDIKNLKAGDAITVVGWPHQTKARELRGHQLHYPDGRVVMLRRGNYIWPQDILRLDRFVMNPKNIPQYLHDVDAGQADATQVVQWIAENDHVARAAYEVTEGRPRLIGLRVDEAVTFAGIDELLDCHTRRDDFIMILDVASLDQAEQAALHADSDYISEFNRVLSRWWEQERQSCEIP